MVWSPYIGLYFKKNLFYTVLNQLANPSQAVRLRHKIFRMLPDPFRGQCLSTLPLPQWSQAGSFAGSFDLDSIIFFEVLQKIQ